MSREEGREAEYNIIGPWNRKGEGGSKKGKMYWRKGEAEGNRA